MRKRITSLLLTLVMLLSLVPAMGVTASAAEPEWTTVNSFKELQDAIKWRKEYIKLGQDIDTASYNEGIGLLKRDELTFNDTSYSCTLDLNGKTLALVSNDTNISQGIHIGGSHLTIKDGSSAKSGKISGAISNVFGGQKAKLIRLDGGKLTLEGGTFTVTSHPYKSNAIVIDSVQGIVTIKDGVKISQPEFFDGGYAYDLDGSGYTLQAENSSYGGGRVIIEGGEFDGCVKLTGSKAENGSVQINGGTFKKDVQVLYEADENNSNPAVTVNGGTFEGTVYLQYWPWKTSLYMPYRLNGGTFKGTVDLYADGGIYERDKPEGNFNIVRGLDKCFGYSAVVAPDGTFTGPNAYTVVLKKTASGKSYKMSLDGTASNPVRIIPNAWGMMESVTLDGNKIDYAKDWNGTPVVLKNNEDHTITFKWKDLADELKTAGYRYDAQCMRYTSGDTTGLIPTDQIPTGTEYSFTIRKGADPNVYSFELRLDLKKDSQPVNTFANEHIVKLMVCEAPPEPPAPVAHSITVTNTFGTATPAKAIAGETITVKANDRTNKNMMFTQWYTKTAGVTFADVTKQETTFVMPDRDVQVYPGYQEVWFTKQPVPQISLEKGYGGKTSFAFSWDISKWELVDTATNQPVSSDNTPVKAGKLTDVTIPANTDLGHKTYRIVVTTANGEQFKSNDFIVTWFEKMPAPLVEFSIPSDTKFIGEMTVNVGCPSTLETGGVSPFETCYTTNGVDPKEAAPSDIQHYSGRTDVTLTQTTHFMARTILEGEGGNEDTWGELCEATYTMIDKLDTPTVTPESCSYSGSLPIIVTIQDVYNAKIDYSVKQHDGYLSGGDVAGPMLETGLSDTFCGTTTFSAKAIVYKDGGGAWESDEVTYTYTREYWANISNATISGKVGKAIEDTDVTITLDGEKFKDVAVGDDVFGWFTNLPAGLTAKVKEQTSYSRELVITISGTPTATSAAAITVTIPKDKLLANGTVDLTVLSNPKAVYNIGTDVAHTHDYTGQPYLYLDPGNHYQECKAGDGYNILAHEFTPWTDNGNGTHSRHCTVCKMTDSSTYTETANHNWQWVVDTAATPNAAGKQHEECVDCHAKRSENTEIPMLTSIKVEHLTVAKPVKDAAATAPTTTDSTYTVANTEWMAADGTPLAIGGKFQPGTVYTVKITLETAGAGVFSVKSTYNPIEGKTATVSPNLTGDNHADSVILTYTFDATEGTYVPTKPAITTVTLPDGKVGDAYSQTLAATGTNPITWSIEAGTLPDGLTLVGDTIKGTPSKAGDFKFTVKATNGGGSDTKELTIKVADAEAAKYHNVTLTGAGTGATGAGSHAAGTTVNIYAGTKSGYTFNGWTSDDVTVLSASSKNASFVMPDKDVTVKANWVYNGGSSGGGYTYYTIKATAGVNGSISPTGNVSVREGRDQTFTITPNKGYAVAKVLIDSKNVGAVKSYTFENVKKNHTIEVVFMKASGNPQTGVFVDVPEGSYYEEAVNWAVDKGITTGTDATHFSPDGICTRAQAVTFLWRAAGSPAAKSAVMPFTDVKAGSYYYDAVLWAVENGITKGTSDTMFSPDATCSRAQIVTFLWRSQKSPAAGTANPFTDVKASAYYADAVLWAVKEDVTKGTTNTTFSPDANCTRAQIVTFIWRALAE